MTQLIAGLVVNKPALRNGFTPAVFAADRALGLAARGMPFRDAYNHIKKNLGELKSIDPADAIALKTHLGATAGLDFGGMARRLSAERAFAAGEKRRFDKIVSRLLPFSHVKCH
jgi:hypothetical protein